MTEKKRVMLATEGTYPFHQGGVSTWCDILVNQLPDYEFVLFSIIMNPYVTQKFSLPPNATLIKVPLWGTEEPSEHLSIPFSQVFLAKRRTTDEIIREKFLPAFTELVDEFIGLKKDPERLGSVLLQLHDYFDEYEYKESFKSRIIWDSFKDQIIRFSRDPKNGLAEPSIFALTQSLGWIYRFFNILNTPIPEVDVSHSAAAAFCGIPCVLAKIKFGTPFILTEHGVYLREQYFSLSQRGYISYMNTFLIRMIRSVTALNYHFADQVSPVCAYNIRWEMEFGVPRERIKVIYNGVDKNIFSPAKESVVDTVPTVVTVARIDPIKDLKTMLEAAAFVKEKIEKVRFIVYGVVAVEDYYQECLGLREKLGLTDCFTFAGHITDIASAYRGGDIIASSSISEAFPYSVIEAMLVGKPIIATDVGGIREAVGDCGILIEPRNPRALADGIIQLLQNRELRESLAEDARNRALSAFTLEKVMELYDESYRRMAAGNIRTKTILLLLEKQKLLLERCFALSLAGFFEEAAKQYGDLLKLNPPPQLAAFILAELARLSELRGQYEEAELNSDKAEALSAFTETNAEAS